MTANMAPLRENLVAFCEEATVVVGERGVTDVSYMDPCRIFDGVTQYPCLLAREAWI